MRRVVLPVAVLLLVASPRGQTGDTASIVIDAAKVENRISPRLYGQFAEFMILPRASNLWVQASLGYRQRLQQLFFPEGIAFDGNRFNRTAATAPLFKYLALSERADERVECEVHLRAARYGGQPSRGLPTVARAEVDKRERRLVSRAGAEPDALVRPPGVIAPDWSPRVY